MGKNQKKIRNKRNRNKKGTDTSKNRNPGFYLFFGVLFIGMPFVYYRDGLDPAIHPRLLFVSALLILSLVAFFWLKRKSPLNTSVLRDPVFYFIGAYFVITALSIIFAVNPREGNYDINKSFVFLVLTGILSILMTNTPDWQKKLPVLFLFPAIYLLGVGISEYFKYVMFATTARDPENLPWIYQVRGEMAHKNQYAIALMLMLPFLGYGAFKPGKVPRIIYILVVAAILFALVILETRSVWVGLAVSVFLIGLFFIFYGNRFGIPLLPRRITGLSGLTLIVGLGTFVYFSHPENKESVLYKIKNIANPTEENNIHRLKIWELSVQMIGEHLITGVGAGNWKIDSRHHFGQYGFTKEQLNWLRPHNDYLWVITEKGIFGFIAFIGIFILIMIKLRRLLLSGAGIDETIFVLLMFTGVVSYLMVSFFTFPLERMNQQVYLALIIASVLAMDHQKNRNSKTPVRIKPFTIVAILMLGYGIVYASSVMKMETLVSEARHYHRTQQWQKLLDISKKIPKTFKTLDAEATPIAWYNGLANSKLGNLEAAKTAYEEAHRAHPTHIQVLNNLGRIYFQLGEYEKARDAFGGALDILPDYYESLVNITSTYMQLGDYKSAKVYLGKIKHRDMNEQLRRMRQTINRKLSEKEKSHANN